MTKRTTAEERKLIDSIDKQLSELRGKIGKLQDERGDLESALEEVTDADERTVLNEEIDRLTEVIGGVNANIEKLRSDKQKLKDAKQASEDYKWEKVKPDILNAAKLLNMSYNVESGKFIYCMDMSDGVDDNINPVFRSFEANKVEAVMSKELGRWLPDANYDIKRLFVQEGMTHNQETASFYSSKWSKRRVYNKAHIIRNFWVDPIFDQEYNKDFDLLIYCVGGGKQENIEHLEQWLAYKYLYPERVANTPNLDIGGNPGGNGKGIYANLAKTIFTGECVKPAVAKELNDGFNASWELAVILHFDEPEEKELPASKMKNATGGTEQRVERKGVDAYSSDRIHSILATSNNTLGVFKLAGTGKSGEDRRYSVISTDIPLAYEIMEREGVDELTAKARANAIASLVQDRKEVARWLGAMLLKHNIQNLEVLSALHGQDYLARFEDQKSNVEEVMDALMPRLVNNGSIGTSTLSELLHAKLDMQRRPTGKTIVKWVSEWAAKSRTKFVKRDQCRFKILNGTKTVTSSNQTVIDFTPNGDSECQLDWTLVSTNVYNPMGIKPEHLTF